MKISNCFVDGISTALPPRVITQEEGSDFLKAGYTGRLKGSSIRLMERVFAHPSVKSRRFAFSDPAALLDEDPGVRPVERIHRAHEVPWCDPGASGIVSYRGEPTP